MVCLQKLESQNNVIGLIRNPYFLSITWSVMIRGGGKGYCPLNFLKVIGFSEISCWKIFRLLLLMKVTVLNFIGKSLSLPPNHAPTGSTGAMMPLSITQINGHWLVPTNYEH